MKKIYVAFLLMLNLQAISMYAAQDSLQDTNDIMTQHMKDIFLNTLDTAIKEGKNLDQFHDSLFLYVMQYKNDHMIRDLLYEWGEIKDKNGRTPLQNAIRNNHTEIATMLIDADAGLNTQDKHGWTPLHTAAFFNRTDITSMLIAECKNINAQDEDGFTPLHIAAMTNHAEMARILIDAGADLTMKDKENITAEQASLTSKIKKVFTQAAQEKQKHLK